MLRALTLSSLVAFSPIALAGQSLESWVVTRSGGELTSAQARRLIQDTRECSSRHGVPEKLVWQVMATESSFDKRAVSSAGAQGLMQVMRRWHPEKVKGRSLFNQKVNVCVGSQILAQYLDQYGTVRKALHAYNGLHGRPGVYARKVLSVRVPPLTDMTIAQVTPPPSPTPMKTSFTPPPVEPAKADWYGVIDFLKSARSRLTHPPTPSLTQAQVILAGPEGAYRDRIALR